MLLNGNMLPRIKTGIPQMADLMQAEQGYLDVILDMAAWLGDRMVLLREEVMNLPNLKTKIRQITGWDCEILEDAEHLTLTIRYYFDAKSPLLEQETRILMYIPAHLKVIHEFLQSYQGTEGVYIGSGLGEYVKYTGYPQAVNGTKEGTVTLGIQKGIYMYNRLIAYPEV